MMCWLVLGTTPERRQFSYPHTLAKTENHSTLLEVFHMETLMNQATNTPLPLLSDFEVRLVFIGSINLEGTIICI